MRPRDGGDAAPPSEIDTRAAHVLDAIYSAFTLGRVGAAPDDALAGALRDEALWLAELTAALLLENAEAKGLRALLLYVSARTAAAGAGGFTPLHEQDVARWDGRRIDEAEALLFEASRLGMPGRYQIEAAIQSVHCSRRITGQVDHAAIERLYDTLLATAKTVTVCAGRFPGWRGGDPMNDDALTLMVLPTVTGPIARPVGANAASQSSDATSCAASSRLTGAAGSVAPSWRIG